MTDAADLLKSIRRSALWFVAWLLATAGLCYLLATAWPYVNLHPQILMVVTVPGLVFRAFDLAWMQVARSVLKGWRRWAMRAFTLVGGFVLMGAMWSATDRISFQRFQAAFGPLVAQVHANAAAPCPPAAKYTVDAGLAAYYDASNGVRVPAVLRHEKGRFVLWLPGRSIDIDGSTLFYDSTTRKWAKFHNDNRDAQAMFEEFVKPMEECKLPLR